MERYKLISDNDGLEIGIAVERPQRDPVAVLQISHGMCGCKERFLPLMEYMAAHGVSCVANDHRGHGLSVKNEKDRGYMYKGGYKALVDDMKMVTDWTRKSFEDVPVFLLGHSMGSLVAGTYLKNIAVPLTE
jgi:alpha-beta hydrolase superfamily lysophospholipase